MSITILKAGIADSFRDWGRKGQRNLGIHPGGFMDAAAAALANILVGNNCVDAVLEMFYPAPVIRFNQPALLCITGADFTAAINGKQILLHRPILADEGDVLEFFYLKSGRIAYLSVYGGFKLQEWLSSYSTNTFLVKGGYKGRHLQKNDEPCFNTQITVPMPTALPGWYIPPQYLQELYGFGPIRIIEGEDWKQLPANVKNIFSQNSYSISNHSNRMGYLLDGAILHTNITTEALSSGVQFGTLQLLPDGSIMALMADHQTTGGYPKLGHIIAADRPRFAQLAPGKHLQFKIVTLQEAESIYLSQQNLLQALQKNADVMREQWIQQQKIIWAPNV